MIKNNPKIMFSFTVIIDSYITSLPISLIYFSGEGLVSKQKNEVAAQQRVKEGGSKMRAIIQWTEDKSFSKEIKFQYAFRMV